MEGSELTLQSMKMGNSRWAGVAIDMSMGEVGGERERSLHQCCSETPKERGRTTGVLQAGQK